MVYDGSVAPSMSVLALTSPSTPRYHWYWMVSLDDATTCRVAVSPEKIETLVGSDVRLIDEHERMRMIARALSAASWHSSL